MKIADPVLLNLFMRDNENATSMLTLPVLTIAEKGVYPH